MVGNTATETAAPRRVVRPRKKSAAASAVTVDAPAPSAPARSQTPQDPWAPAPLDEGDKIEYGITAEVKNRAGRSFWCKGGAIITVRPGESPEEAKSRVSAFVLGMVNQQMAEYLD